MRVVAVDWSGKETGAEESIWCGECVDGRLTDLGNGRSREELVHHLVALAGEDPHMVVGLDFAFSFPKPYCDERGWETGRAVWEAMTSEAAELLANCEAPFWGRPGKKRPLETATAYRRTERAADGPPAKSVFQIGGAGAVGTGSLRGMPHLLDLASVGFCIWPFEAARFPLVVEIYPRSLTGAVSKSRWKSRHAYLLDHFSDQPAELLERAAGSEDAFDAAASALVMSRHGDSFDDLPQGDEIDRIEGRIWRPPG